MPSSVKDRFTNKWESVFFFAKEKKYYFNLDIVREECITKPKPFNVRVRDSNNARFLQKATDEEKANHNKKGEKKPYAVVEREGVIYYRNLPTHNEIREYLTDARKKIGMTIDELEDIFDNYTPHHWFDKDGSYPTKEDWIKAKEILKFDDKYDEVMTIEYPKDAAKVNNPKGKNPGDIFEYRTGTDLKENYDGSKYSNQKEEGLHRQGLYKGKYADSKDVNHPLGKNPGDIFLINTKAYKGAHFAVFPPALPEKILKCSCPKDGLVLDPFLGSGTTAWVAQQLNLNWIGIELNEEYAKIAKDRLGLNNSLGDYL